MEEDEENEAQSRNNNNRSPMHDGFESDSRDVGEQSAPETCWNKFILCVQRRNHKSQSSHTESLNQEEINKKPNPFLRGLVIAFSRRPLVVLLITILLALSGTWLGLTQYGWPEFDDPYLV